VGLALAARLRRDGRVDLRSKMAVFFLILLVIALLLLGIFVVQNSSTEQVSFLTFHWAGVPQWLPPVLAGGAVAILLVLYMLVAGGRRGIRQRGVRGRADSRISALESENERLRQELAELRNRRPKAPSDL
jgi:uncharacterized integral membrane protein